MSKLLHDTEPAELVSRELEHEARGGDARCEGAPDDVTPELLGLHRRQLDDLAPATVSSDETPPVRPDAERRMGERHPLYTPQTCCALT